MILNEASIFFADVGFSASTRDLADRLGVRQALLYKYFASKEALLEAIFEAVFADLWTMSWASALDDHSLPLADRLVAFYMRYIQDASGIRLRLFMRAALDGWPLPAKLARLLSEKLIVPLIAELRNAGSLVGLDERPLLVGEHELVMTLHSSIIFYGMRGHIYRANIPADSEDVVRLYVSTFLDGARATLPGLHRLDAPASLAAPVIAASAV